MFSLPVTISHHSPLHIDLFFEVLDWEDHLRHWTLGIFEAHAGIRLLVHCKVERIAHVVGLASLILCVLFTQNRVLLAIFSLIWRISTHGSHFNYFLRFVRLLCSTSHDQIRKHLSHWAHFDVFLKDHELFEDVFCLKFAIINITIRNPGLLLGRRNFTFVFLIDVLIRALNWHITIQIERNLCLNLIWLFHTSSDVSSIGLDSSWLLITLLGILLVLVLHYLFW